MSQTHESALIQTLIHLPTLGQLSQPFRAVHASSAQLLDGTPINTSSDLFPLLFDACRITPSWCAKVASKLSLSLLYLIKIKVKENLEFKY